MILPGHRQILTPLRSMWPRLLINQVDASCFLFFFFLLARPAPTPPRPPPPPPPPACLPAELLAYTTEIMKQRMSNKSGSVIISHRWLVADLRTVCSSGSSGSLRQRLPRHQSANQTAFTSAGAPLTNCFRFQRNVSTSAVFFFFFSPLLFPPSTEGKGRCNEAVQA